MSQTPTSELRSLRVTIHLTRILYRPSHIFLTLFKDLVASCNSSNNVNTMVVAVLDAFWRSNNFTPLKSASAQVNATLGMRYRMLICIAELKTDTFSRRAIAVEILVVLLQGLVVLLWWELEEHQAALPHQCWCSNFHYHCHCFPWRIAIQCLSNCLSTNACNMLNCTALWAYLPCWTCLGTVDNMLYLWIYRATAVVNVCCMFVFPLEQCIVAAGLVWPKLGVDTKLADYCHCRSMLSKVAVIMVKGVHCPKSLSPTESSCLMLTAITKGRFWVAFTYDMCGARCVLCGARCVFVYSN